MTPQQSLHMWKFSFFLKMHCDKWEDSYTDTKCLQKRKGDMAVLKGNFHSSFIALGVNIHSKTLSESMNQLNNVHLRERFLDLIRHYHCYIHTSAKTILHQALDAVIKNNRTRTHKIFFHCFICNEFLRQDNDFQKLSLVVCYSEYSMKSYHFMYQILT